jgi:eukaryotic-like serine/threonine-protein kinase
LYELLTLHPAFNGGDRQELLQQITQEDPKAPRSIDKNIPIELETIVLKAIAKNPSERYATAQEMADDLQRFLDDKPVLAKRPTLLDKARKWQRRHKAVVVSAIVSAFLLLLVASLGLWQVNSRIAEEQAKTQAALEREQLKAHEAAEQRTRAEEERTRAESNLQQARLFIEVITQFAEDALANEPKLKRKLLEVTCRYYKKFIDQSQQDPKVQDELVAASLAHLSNILDQLGDPEGSMITGTEALSILESKNKPNDPDFNRQKDFIQHHLCHLQGGGQLWRLRKDDVQQDLGISDDQRREIERVWQEFEQQRRFREDSPSLTEEQRDEKRKQFKERAEANEKKVAHLLTAEQTERLKQINLQVRVPYTFRDEEVAAVLGLSPEQRRDILNMVMLHKERIDAVRHHSATPRLPSDQARLFSDGVRKATTEEILAMFTDQQRNIWTQLIGKPFVAAPRTGPGEGHPQRTRFDPPYSGFSPKGSKPAR